MGCGFLRLDGRDSPKERRYEYFGLQLGRKRREGITGGDQDDVGFLILGELTLPEPGWFSVIAHAETIALRTQHGLLYIDMRAGTIQNEFCAAAVRGPRGG
jgi:hypothetical protein